LDRCRTPAPAPVRPGVRDVGEPDILESLLTTSDHTRVLDYQQLETETQRREQRKGGFGELLVCAEGTCVGSGDGRIDPSDGG